MALTQIPASRLAPGAVTEEKIASNAVTADKVAEGVAGGPKITTVAVTDNAYTVLDDTAVDLAGGYIKITGTGFVSGCQLLINSTPATSTTFVSSTEVRAQVPAQSAGTYVVYLVNPDGGVAIRINGITYSAMPAWVTGSTIAGVVNQAISLQLDATSATNYALQEGSSLPTGLTLTAGGLLSGTVTGITEETTYSFTIVATDIENQDSPRTFSITIIVGDQYFKDTVLLLSGDGTDGDANSTFTDSSTNNFTITRNGNPTQGAFSPFGPVGWSAYFDGNGDYISFPSSTAANFGTDDFTVEFWIFPEAGTANLFDFRYTENAVPWSILLRSDNIPSFYNGTEEYGSTALVLNEWSHVAFSRSGSTHRIFINGTLTHSFTDNVNYSSAAAAGRIGANLSNSNYFKGYISNVRIVKGTAVYTSNFSVATSSLSAITNTTFLSLQDNRFVDNSTNAFTITNINDAKIKPFSPFNVTEAYSNSTHGGSLYLDGTGDFITAPSDSAFNITGDFTIECYFYPIGATTSGGLFSRRGSASQYGPFVTGFTGTGHTPNILLSTTGGDWNVNLSSSIQLQPKAWNHISFTRSGSTVTIWVNGQSAGTASLSGSLVSSSVGVTIGASAINGDFLNTGGYISGFRFVNGTAVYTSAFTPPTTPPTAIANTSLLLNFTSAGIYDLTTKHVLETVGNAQISTSVKKYGTGSIYFDGTGDKLTIPTNDLLSLGTGNWTIETWVYQTSNASNVYTPIISGSTGTYNFPIILDYSGSGFSAGKVGFYLTNGSTGVSSTTPLSLNTWTHLALVKNGSSIVLYCQGISVASTTSATATCFIDTIGGWSTNLLTGYLDDVRITKGVARYTTNFTPPLVAFIGQ